MKDPFKIDKNSYKIFVVLGVFGTILLGLFGLVAPYRDARVAEQIAAYDMQKYTESVESLDQCLESRGLGYGSVEERAAQAAKFSIYHYRDTIDHNSALKESICGDEEDLGFSVVTNFQKQLSSPMTADQDYVPLTNLTLTGETDTTCAAGANCLDVSALGDEIFVTIDPGKSRIELVKCTGSSTTTNRLTSCTRGLAFSGSSEAAVTANASKHSAGATVVVSNAHYIYEKFLDLTGRGGTTQTLTGDFTTTGTLTIAPSDGNVYLGDNTTGANKSIYADNGETNEPFFRYNETTNQWEASDNGVDTVSITSSSAAGLSASSTQGIGITDSKILINASSTASTNGGFLDFSQISGTGYLFFDAPNFVANAWTWSAAQIISSLTATTTADNFQVTSDADSANDVTRQSYVESQISQSVGQGTSGEAYSAGELLYLKASDSRLYPADSDADESTYSFVGIAIDAATGAGESVTFTKPGGINTNMSGLTAGSYYFIGSTDGTPSASPASTRKAKIGQALSTTSMRVIEPKFVRSGHIASTSTGALVVTTGFYPVHIEFLAGPDAAGAGISIGTSENNVIAARTPSANSDGYSDETNAWYIYNRNLGDVRGEASVTARDQDSFTVNATAADETINVYWTAWSL